MSDARKIILARRARFVAAALAGSGLATPAARAGSETDDPVAIPDCEKDPEACRPQICLSDDDIEGELVEPPTCPDGSVQPEGQPCPPEVCLSVALCPPGEEMGDDFECQPQICLSIHVADPSDNLPEYHDGFYLRLSIGPGWLHTSTKGDLPDGSASGPVVAGNLGVGLTVAHGLALGLFAGVVHAPSPTAEGGVVNFGDGPSTLVLLGPFFDYFPRSSDGFHFGLAPGALLLRRGAAGAGGVSTSAAGVGAALWVGYDFWISDDWSVGAAVKGDGGFAWGTTGQVSERIASRGAALMFSALWH